MGQTIAFRGLSSLTKGRLVDRREKNDRLSTWSLPPPSRSGLRSQRHFLPLRVQSVRYFNVSATALTRRSFVYGFCKKPCGLRPGNLRAASPASNPVDRMTGTSGLICRPPPPKLAFQAAKALWWRTFAGLHDLPQGTVPFERLRPRRKNALLPPSRRCALAHQQADLRIDHRLWPCNPSRNKVIQSPQL